MSAQAENVGTTRALAGGIAHRFQQSLTAIMVNFPRFALVSPDDEMGPFKRCKKRIVRARDLAQQLSLRRGGAPIKKTASSGKLIEDTVSFSLRCSHSRSEFYFAQI